MAGLNEAAAWWDNERSALAKKFARAWEAALSDPKGAFKEFAKGTEDYAAGRLEGLLRAEVPGVSFLPKGTIKEHLSPAPDWEQSTDAREVGELAGAPEPGGGQAQTAQREIMQKVGGKLKAASLAELYRSGDPKTVWDKYGTIVTGKEVYKEMEGSGDMRFRSWRPGEQQTKFGDLIEYPAFVKEYNSRSGGFDLNEVPVIRAPGASGKMSPKLQSVPDPGSVPLRLAELKIGDVSMREIIEHELNHGLEMLQSGRVPGSNAEHELFGILKDPRSNPKQLTPGQILQFKNGHPDPFVQAYAKDLYSRAYYAYLKNPGEARSRVAGDRVHLMDDERKKAFPLEEDQTVNAYTWDKQGAEHTLLTGKPTTLTPKEWNANMPQLGQAVKSEGLDDLLKKPRSEKLDDILAELLSAP